MKIKIVFILPSLKAGGAERVLSFLSKRVNPNIYDITLLILGFEKDNAYDVSNVNTKYLNKNRLINSIVPLYFFFKRQKPDLVMSSIGHVNLGMSFLSLFFPKIIFIAREASVISKIGEFSSKKSLIPHFIIQYLYKRLDGIICQSNDMKNDMQKIYSLKESKMFTINNPAPDYKEIKKKTRLGKAIHFITIGRLSPEKGHRRIMKILSELTINYHYTIIGNGPEKENLLNLAKDLNIESKIEYVEFTNRVSDYISAHDIFLQGSYVEGFPNALMESCAFGTPVIAFNAPGGTKEIVINGQNGFIVETGNEFKEKISYLIGNKLDQKKIQNTIYDRFSSKKIVMEYETVFQHFFKNPSSQILNNY